MVELGIYSLRSLFKSGGLLQNQDSLVVRILNYNLITKSIHISWTNSGMYWPAANTTLSVVTLSEGTIQYRPAADSFQYQKSLPIANEGIISQNAMKVHCCIGRKPVYKEGNQMLP
jgi:hypothetical protein